jgi:hypothetical protein
MLFGRRAAVAALVIALFVAGGAWAQPANVSDIDSDGLKLRVLFVMPQGHPRAAVVMFPGGDGRIGISESGVITRPGNFLIRTRDLWLARGFMFVAIDSIDGLNDAGDRIGPAMRGAIARIVSTVRTRTDAPIWLVGTSAGTPSAMAGAASLPNGAIRGVVISSPVSVSRKRASVFDVPLDHVTVPVLIQAHQNDGCPITPPSNAAYIKAALTASAKVDVETFTGGDAPRSKPCEAFSQHGFLGIETQVVAAAADWIVSH